MGLTGKAVIAGFAEFKNQRSTMFKRADSPVSDTPTTLELSAELTLRALADAGLTLKDLNGIAVMRLLESDLFQPMTLAEYLGLTIDYADTPDIGGAGSAAMVGRAALAIEAGMADAVICVVVGAAATPSSDGASWHHFGGSSYNEGSPAAEFEIPYGILGTNVPYAMIAQRYGHEFGYDDRAMAKLVTQQRVNACANPNAIFYGHPLSEEEFLASPVIASPLRMLEIVRPVVGGGAVLVTSAELAAKGRNRPVHVMGYGEAVGAKMIHFSEDLFVRPLERAAKTAFRMAGIAPSDVDITQIYDCYSIQVVMALESAGFCARGEGQKFIQAHDLTYKGDFPLNTNGGQLGAGQPAFAGGMSHVVEAARQGSGRAGDRQVSDLEHLLVVGNGGVMGEQNALVLRTA